MDKQKTQKIVIGAVLAVTAFPLFGAFPKSVEARQPIVSNQYQQNQEAVDSRWHVIDRARRNGMDSFIVDQLEEGPLAYAGIVQGSNVLFMYIKNGQIEGATVPRVVVDDTIRHIETNSLPRIDGADLLVDALSYYKQYPREISWSGQGRFCGDFSYIVNTIRQNTGRHDHRRQSTMQSPMGPM